MFGNGTVRVKTFLVCLLAALAFAFSTQAFATAGDPLEQVKVAVDEIIEIMKGDSPDSPALDADRRARVITIVEANFDFREMSMRTLAKHWRTASQGEKDRFVSLFTKLLEDTYLKKIDTYSGEKVIFKKKAIKGDKAMVYTDLVRNNVETPVNYRLQSGSEKWMVYDVVIEGVSLVRNYRSQFDSILQKEDFNTLLARIQEKIDKAEEEQQ